MPEWLILLIIWFIVMRVQSRGSRCGPRSVPRRRHTGLHYARGMRLNPPAAPPAETPLQSLQREFVSGAITVEQYEQKLDRLLRRPGGARSFDA